MFSERLRQTCSAGYECLIPLVYQNVVIGYQTGVRNLAECAHGNLNILQGCGVQEIRFILDFGEVTRFGPSFLVLVLHHLQAGNFKLPVLAKGQLDGFRQG